MLKWILVLAGYSGLIAVRGLEDKIFYDPFLTYIKSADQSAAFPQFVWAKLILS